MPTFTRILVATDFSDAAEAALAYGRTLASQSGAALDVLHVAPDLSAGVTGLQGFADDLGRLQTETEEIARRDLRGRLTDHDRHDLSARAVVLTGQRPAEVILRYAQDEHADLIVVGAQSRTGVAHLLLGSVAERVVRHATCPVLTVRGSAA